ncbi:tRNA (N6-threonylcarbamoyladenosine(37)-N6)-methyltransferase TrmO [Simiduia sp. 21SJ11W-1]|uniref:tRNA (N6-threonylcarbamoyladenosine(37)-N6)-methyltransferase TrmO n=1 Tax=Simiduia sp. 21SJ11W-1 TaxID=2909669 RepID=UPI00209EDF61|nr:tRNA (N6-threonylcarbamoyladenosine(37)-N6)-methyltransferase TrmO [Simiduia sp. 21SJ11W-1]UTA48010.1 tRNA (N6-threonylcarbamoyladenosine(37)-N6)-methyltransferase TrmO [Simiduia sp. 21SJ11W-1]
MTQAHFQVSPIGIIHSCFKEKFGVPRQSALAPSALACLELLPPYNSPDGVQGLEQVSHLWLQFVFHLSPEPKSLKVRPPRLGGNQKVGVFATRSPVRPNRLGLSVVQLLKIEQAAGSVRLWLAGADLVDGTPVLDIKPYVPYADALPQASNALAPTAPALIAVEIPEALAVPEPVARLVREVLSQDPRPAYQQIDPERIYGMHLLDFNLQWRYLVSGAAQVVALTPIEGDTTEPS